MEATVQPATTQLTVYNFDRFHKLMVDGACLVGSGGRIIIDLRTLQYMDLFAMISLIYACKDLRETIGCRIKLEMGEWGDSRACGFFPRIGFLDALTAICGDQVEQSDTFPPARVQLERERQGENEGILELTVLDSVEVVRAIPNKLINILLGQLHHREPMAVDMGSAFSEVCQNVLDHNPGHGHGLAAMQISEAGTGRFMQFVVADRGAGIRATLLKNPMYENITSDRQAIIKSTEVGVTSVYDDPTRGNGLPKLLELSLKHGGSIHIRSGTGKVYWRGAADYRCFTFAPLSGTQISVTVNAVYPGSIQSQTRRAFSFRIRLRDHNSKGETHEHLSAGGGRHRSALPDGDSI